MKENSDELFSLWREKREQLDAYAHRYRAFKLSQIIKERTSLAEEFDKVREVVSQLGDADTQLQALGEYLGVSSSANIVLGEVPSKATNAYEAYKEWFRHTVTVESAYSNFQIARVQNNWKRYPFDPWKKVQTDNYQAGGKQGITVENWLRAVFAAIKQGAKDDNVKGVRDVVICEVPYRTDSRDMKKLWVKKVALLAGLDVTVYFSDELS